MLLSLAWKNEDLWGEHALGKSRLLMTQRPDRLIGSTPQVMAGRAVRGVLDQSPYVCFTLTLSSGLSYVFIPGLRSVRLLLFA